MVILALPIVLIFPGICIVALALLFRGLGMSKRQIIFASFAAFGLLSGLMLASSKSSEGLQMVNIIGENLGERIYEFSIDHFGNPHSSNAHYTIPWLLRLPQVRLFTSVVPLSFLGLLAQLVYNRVKKPATVSKKFSAPIMAIILLLCVGISAGVVFGLQSEDERYGTRNPYASPVMRIEFGTPPILDWKVLDGWVIDGVSFATWGDNGLVPKEEDFEAGKDILVSVDIRNPTSEKGMAKVDL
ncbi:MAG: hypothetical protein WC749_14410, partial [Dehalococcoidia bacterium]